MVKKQSDKRKLTLIEEETFTGGPRGEIYQLADEEKHRHSGPHESMVAPRNRVIKIADGGPAEPLANVPPRAAARHNPHLGDLIDRRYRLDEKVGEGGVCAVYKAYDELLRMTVAVKALKSEASGDPDFVQTLLDEARSAMQLSHSQIVRLHTLQKTAGYYYLVMEYLQGQTLRECLADYDALPVTTVAEIMEAIYPPLRHAHKRGILHNDIKPDNILLTDSGSIKFIDFGLSCLANQPPGNHALLGTPAYMSPERLNRGVLDLRSDIYSLGLTAYELLTGSLPFPEGLTPGEHAGESQLKLGKAPERLRPVLEKAVAHNRADRWETVDDFVEAFLKQSIQ